MQRGSPKAETGCLQDLRNTINSAWKGSMVPENEMGLLQRSERSMVGVMCGLQFKDGERVRDLMLMVDLNETTNQLAMASGARWYGHALRSKDAYVMKKALEFEVKVKGKKGR